jgi:hypothetical protein
MGGAGLWLCLSYSAATPNDQKILGGDLIAGDVLGLMFDIDAELDKAGIPVL